jgi:hypothetical protein
VCVCVYRISLVLLLKNNRNGQAYDSFEYSLSFFDSIGLLASLVSPISLLYECHRIGKRAAYTYAFFYVDCLRNDLIGLIYHKLSSMIVKKTKSYRRIWKIETSNLKIILNQDFIIFLRKFRKKSIQTIFRKLFFIRRFFRWINVIEIW